eukprot:s524_g25.t1
MAVAQGLGKVVPLAVGFQLITCCQCLDRFGMDVVTDAMPVGFSKLPTPEPSSLDDIRFHCSVAPLKSEKQCIDHSINGGCRAGNKCYIKDDGPQHIYATCCCSETDTPIRMIEHNCSNWSCYASEVDSLSETGGRTPWCGIHCCRRPALSRSCHGNKPICCNAKVESCGITLQGEPCCAANHKEANATCCHDVGTTCWSSPASWMVPFLPGTPCCLEHLPDVTCVLQSNCSEGFGGALGWSGATVLAAAGSQAFFYMKGSGADLLPGRRWCWYLKMAAPGLCLFLALLVVVYVFYLHIWEKVTITQTAKVCVWWAMWSLLAMQATVCDGLSFNAPNQAVAFLSNISSQELNVIRWYDLTKKQAEAMLGQIEPYLRGANGPTVWMHISCHSQTVFGCPQFLPADAGVFGDGVSIFKLVRKLSSVAGCRGARIHVTVNGCMEIPRGLERFVWWWRYGLSQDRVAGKNEFFKVEQSLHRLHPQFLKMTALQTIPPIISTENPFLPMLLLCCNSQDDFRLSPPRRLLPRSEAQAWILFACHPGRAVPGSLVWLKKP